MMSHNRLVFLTAFAILALMAIGLENLLEGLVEWRWWFWLPATLLLGLGGWCIYRSIYLPEPIATQIEQTIRDIGTLREIQAWFIEHYTMMGVFCIFGFLGWLSLRSQKAGNFRWLPLLVVFLLADLLWFDFGRSAQCDPAFYFPEIPVLDEIAKSVPGRVIGINCLPSSVAAMEGLNDIRGYDAVDPARMVELLTAAAQPGKEPSWEATQFLVPKGNTVPPSTIHLSPVWDMLTVRYVIYRGVPSPRVHPAYQGDDYWVLINSNALPRPFVPKSVQTISKAGDMLKKMSSSEFNPAEAAYVETPVELPADCRGRAYITRETPTHITILAEMETAGLIVLADNWDKGWRAYWNGRVVPVLRADYTVRGVIVPAGNGTLEFIYQPASLILGLWLAGFAVFVLVGWLVVIWIKPLPASNADIVS